MTGVVGVEVSPKAVPHPTRSEIFTLGECIPESLGDRPRDQMQSRIVLYHGSFQALARGDTGFDWEAETWETLTHELRHHLEWRANEDDLEEFDAAAEHNFARHEQDAFDPQFYLAGEQLAPDVYQVDHDVFIDRVLRGSPSRLQFGWAGKQYEVELPAGLRLPALLEVEGVEHPPSGSLVLALRRRASLLNLFRAATVHRGIVPARPLRVS